MDIKPTIIRQNVFDMQVCVPKEYTDEQIKEFAETLNPCGASSGWFIRKDKKLLNGDKERCPCDNNKNLIHVALDA